jgi:hypothetical protein
MTKDREVNPPSATLLALEGRGLFDMASLATAAPFLTLAPRGTRHAVIVLPGLGADDRSTRVILVIGQYRAGRRSMMQFER